MKWIVFAYLALKTFLEKRGSQDPEMKSAIAVCSPVTITITFSAYLLVNSLRIIDYSAVLAAVFVVALPMFTVAQLIKLFIKLGSRPIYLDGFKRIDNSTAEVLMIGTVAVAIFTPIFLAFLYLVLK